jgi:hypothetical protein
MWYFNPLGSIKDVLTTGDLLLGRHLHDELNTYYSRNQRRRPLNQRLTLGLTPISTKNCTLITRPNHYLKPHNSPHLP